MEKDSGKVNSGKVNRGECDKEIAASELESVAGGETASRMACANNLKQLGIAMH